MIAVAISVPLAIVGAGLGAWAALGYFSGRAFVENAKYVRHKSHPTFEVRRYNESVAAKVYVDDDDIRRAGNVAFRRIAGYIFGGNLPRDAATSSTALLGTSSDSKGTSIAMTSPVVAIPASRIAMTSPVVSEAHNGGVEVAFIMPSKYRRAADLPVPRDSTVRLEELPARWEAVMGWYGNYASKEQFESRTRDLLAALRKEGYTAVSVAAGGEGMQIGPEERVVAKSYSYDPPWTPWFMKKNEVSVVIDTPQDFVDSHQEAKE